MLSVSAADLKAPKLIARIRRQGLTWVLASAIVLLQYPLWLGDGGWLRVREGAQKIDTQETLNLRLETRNASLLAEINDLKQGRDAVEERARNDLGMMAPDEWFVRVVPAQSVQSGKTNE
ncbi:MAG: cell division protein FtsB [Hyphomicrobiaceae bacterium]